MGAGGGCRSQSGRSRLRQMRGEWSSTEHRGSSGIRGRVRRWMCALKTRPGKIARRPPWGFRMRSVRFRCFAQMRRWCPIQPTRERTGCLVRGGCMRRWPAFLQKLHRGETRSARWAGSHCGDGRDRVSFYAGGVGGRRSLEPVGSLVEEHSSGKGRVFVSSQGSGGGRTGWVRPVVGLWGSRRVGPMVGLHR